MAIDFTKLAEAPLLEEAPETSNVLVEVDQHIHRVPRTQMGSTDSGGGGGAGFMWDISDILKAGFAGELEGFSVSDTGMATFPISEGLWNGFVEKIKANSFIGYCYDPKIISAESVALEDAWMTVYFSLMSYATMKSVSMIQAMSVIGLMSELTDLTITKFPDSEGARVAIMIGTVL